MAMGRAGWLAAEYQLPYGCQVLGAWLSGVQYAEKQQLSACMQGLYEDAACGCTACALRTAVARSAAYAAGIKFGPNSSAVQVQGTRLLILLD